MDRCISTALALAFSATLAGCHSPYRSDQGALFGGLTGAGVGIGAVLAWSVTRAMDSLLYGVGAADPLTFALVAGLLTAVSAVACGIPAVRAARVDPMLVLRDQ